MTVTVPAAEYRFYSSLASWWPLISPPSEYAEEAAHVAKLFAAASGTVREVLELGSGGGHNAAHLKAGVDLTLVDASADMLRVSRQLNPECEHVQGDMRTVRLGRTFDAVFVHDAVDYLTCLDDLRQAFETAYAHCRPGGVAVFVPDATAETFTEGSECGGSDGPDGRAARYVEWTWDPDPADTDVLTEYVFILRQADGSVTVEHETHRTGLFPREVWLELLTVVGFSAELVIDETTEDRSPRDLFLARRPPS